MATKKCDWSINGQIGWKIFDNTNEVPNTFCWQFEMPSASVPSIFKGDNFMLERAFSAFISSFELLVVVLAAAIPWIILFLLLSWLLLKFLKYWVRHKREMKAKRGQV